MKKIPLLCLPVFLLLSLVAFVTGGLQHASAQGVASPTPTYDPLVEPFVPDNPTDYELGRNWYWHHCMPCHGDKGQGLTDEFRAVWVHDHQNCWARGCHAGRREDEGFPIPTVVPAIVTHTKLGQFDSIQALYEYLKATHPPQYPGHLQDEQYRAIAVYVFTLNERPLEEPTPLPTLLPTSRPVPEPLASVEPTGRSSTWQPGVIYLGLGIVVVILMIWGLQRRFRA